MFTLLQNGKPYKVFGEAKEYNIGTGYIALQNKESCILCRCIDNESRPVKNTTYILKDSNIDKEKTVIILTDNARSFQLLDKTMANLKKALEGQGASHT